MEISARESLSVRAVDEPFRSHNVAATMRFAKIIIAQRDLYARFVSLLSIEMRSNYSLDQRQCYRWTFAEPAFTFDVPNMRFYVIIDRFSSTCSCQCSYSSYSAVRSLSDLIGIRCALTECFTRFRLFINICLYVSTDLQLYVNLCYDCDDSNRERSIILR